MGNPDKAKARKKRQECSQDNVTSTPKKRKQYSSLSPPRFQPKLSSDVFKTSIISTLDNLQAVHKNMELFEEELRIEFEQKFAHKIDYYKQRLEKAEKKVRTLQTELDEIHQKSKDQAFLQTLQNPPKNEENLDYFHVTRPLGDDLVGKKFDYDMADTKRLGFFEVVPKAIDISLLPYSMVDRFITLLPSDRLRRVSYTSKYFYKKCFSLRGLEVQYVYTTYGSMLAVSRLSCLENGRMVCEIHPNTIPVAMNNFFPYFKTSAFLLHRNFVEKNNFVKNYKYFYAFDYNESFVKEIEPFLHDKLETIEIICYKLDSRLITPLQQLKVKNFSFVLKYPATPRKLVKLGQLLIQCKPEGVQNLYLCHTRSCNQKFSNRIWRYDAVLNKYILQHKDRILNDDYGILNIR